MGGRLLGHRGCGKLNGGLLQPPSTQPIQFVNARTASARTASGRSPWRDCAACSASRRVRGSRAWNASASDEERVIAAAYSGLAPEALTTAPHLAISSRT